MLGVYCSQCPKRGTGRHATQGHPGNQGGSGGRRSEGKASRTRASVLGSPGGGRGEAERAAEQFSPGRLSHVSGLRAPRGSPIGPALGPDVTQGGAGGLDLGSLGRGGSACGSPLVGLHIKASLTARCLLSLGISYLALELPAPPGPTRPRDAKAS